MTESSSPVGKSVLLYSGGLDSFILAALFKPDVLLHLNLGGRYGQVETVRLGTPSGAPNVTMVHLDLGQWEDPASLFVPGRNPILCLVASNYGDRIWLGATAGDVAHDKDDEFAVRMTSLLSHVYQPHWWVPEGRDVRVELPIKHFTKRELVARYVASGLPVDELLRGTFSCYEPSIIGGEECGACKPCIRKWAALVVNGITPVIDAESAARAGVAGGGFNGRRPDDRDIFDALATVDTAG